MLQRTELPKEPQPKHFHDDYLIVRKLYKDEIIELQNEASKALAKVFDAQDRRLPAAEIEKLDRECKRVQANLDRAERMLAASAPIPGSSHGFIRGNFEAKNLAGARPAETKQSRVFTKSDKTKIEEHCNKLPEALKNLIEAALSDDTYTLELVANPVFIIGDGKIYERATVEETWLDKKAEGMHPVIHKPFKRADIISCQTLTNAVVVLLDIIEGKKIAAAPLGEKLASSLKPEMRKRVPAHILKLAEANYGSLEDKHKRLFDMICRDPITNEIMDDPVLLPDGFVCDRSTAVAYLKYKNGECPMNPAISFTEHSITPCYFVVKVLDALVAMIQGKIDAAKAGLPAAPAERPEPSAPPASFDFA